MKNLYLAAMLSMAPAKSMALEMLASWYDHGKVTANGERFKPDGLTAAHKTLPFGTEVWIKHDDKTVKVRINDRGPFIKGRQIDLSRGAARKLGIKDKGVVKLKILKIRRNIN